MVLRQTSHAAEDQRKAHGQRCFTGSADQRLFPAKLIGKLGLMGVSLSLLSLHALYIELE